MHTVQIRGGPSFQAADGQSLLEAAEQSGLVLPYTCRVGRCSTCKALCSPGATQVLKSELGLTEGERSEGWVLACSRAATRDLELSIEVLPERPAAPRILPCRIDSIERPIEDVARVTVRLPPDEPFAFRAGQHVDIIARQGDRRSYSIASPATTPQRLSFDIRRIDGGVLSRYWFEQARPNDLLRLRGPLGTFWLRPAPAHDLVFLATGTGIAPIRSMLEALPFDGPHAPRSVTLYWGNRSPEDFYWQPPANARWRFVPVLSRPPADGPGARGHVQDVFLAQGPDLSRTLVYACGSPSMIESARARLIEAGLDGRRFHADAFVSTS
jgi:CDP-4-dehydro-6-deoxyglucose reductase